MSFNKTPYRIVPLGRCIAAKLYVQLVNDNPKSAFSVEDIAGLFNQDISTNLLVKALNFGRNSYDRSIVLFSRHGNAEKGYTYSLTDEGIQEVERTSRNKSSDIAYFLENGDDSLDQIAGPNAIFWTRDEYLASTHWSHLELEADDPVYKDSVKSVEGALEEIKKSNELTAKYPEEKEGIVQTIREGLKALKSKRPTKAQISDLLIKPLKWIAATFGKTTMGEISKIAAQRLVDLITLIF